MKPLSNFILIAAILFTLALTLNASGPKERARWHVDAPPCIVTDADGVRRIVSRGTHAAQCRELDEAASAVSGYSEATLAHVNADLRMRLDMAQRALEACQQRRARR